MAPDALQVLCNWLVERSAKDFQFHRTPPPTKMTGQPHQNLQGGQEEEEEEEGQQSESEEEGGEGEEDGMDQSDQEAEQVCGDILSVVRGDFVT